MANSESLAQSTHRCPGHDTRCVVCETSAFQRNHYFTGKLLVERDFTDEQRYFMEKLRLHHQRLHGRGVVCGLELRAHPNPACRDRLVVLEPGSAVNCCGHDILVVEPEILELAAFPAIRQLQEEGDDEPHTLQFCIAYRECPTEEVPVLYDECGCDDTQCAPNRILESYAIDVEVGRTVHWVDAHRMASARTIVVEVVDFFELFADPGSMSFVTAINSIIIAIGVLCVLVYFFFSVEHRGPVGVVSKVGIFFLMVSFGAAFGYTVMARVSLLIGRVYFLLHNWLHIAS